MRDKYGMECYKGIKVTETRYLDDGGVIEIDENSLFLATNESLYGWINHDIFEVYNIKKTGECISCIKNFEDKICIGTNKGELIIIDKNGYTEISRHQMFEDVITSIQHLGNRFAIGFSSGALTFLDFKEKNSNYQKLQFGNGAINNISYNFSNYYTVGCNNNLNICDLRISRVKIKTLSFSGKRNGAKFNRITKNLVNYIDFIDRRHLSCYNITTGEIKSNYIGEASLSEIHNSPFFNTIVLNDVKYGGLYLVTENKNQRLGKIENYHAKMQHTYSSPFGKLLASLDTSRNLTISWIFKETEMNIENRSNIHIAIR